MLPSSRAIFLWTLLLLLKFDPTLARLGEGDFDEEEGLDFVDASTDGDEAKEEEIEERSVHVIFRNELPQPIYLYWNRHDGERFVQHQGKPIPPLTEHVMESSYPGHLFSYDYNGETYNLTVPKADYEEQEDVYLYLMADKTEIVVSCMTTANAGLERHVHLDLRVVPNWAPRGAAHFLDLVRAGYYNGGVAIHRVAPQPQFGIAVEQDMRNEWRHKTILDDPKLDWVTTSHEGMLAFASTNGRPHSRTTVVVVTTEKHEITTDIPFGQVLGDVSHSPIPRWSAGDHGEGPDPERMYLEGYDYVRREFPQIDCIESCIVEEDHLVEAEEEL